MTILNDAIKKIAETEELKKLINELRTKQQEIQRAILDARRGIAYKNEAFNSSSSSQNSSVLNAKNLSSQYSSTIPYPVGQLQGSVDGDDLLNDDSGLFTNTAGDKGLYEGDQLREITGLSDCSTGEEYTVRLDGAYKAPAGWTEANTPPGGETDDTWTQGVYYTNNPNPASATIVAESGNLAMDEVLQNLIDSNPTFVYVDTGRIPVASTEINGEAIFTYQISYDVYSGGSLIASGNGLVYPQECTGSETGDAATACAVMSAPTTPQPSDWGEDPSRPLQLSWNKDDGKFKFSQYEFDPPAKFSQGVSQLNLCTTDGDFMTITPTKDGGFAVYETSSSGGPLAVGASIKKFDKNLRSEGVINQDQLDFLLPE